MSDVVRTINSARNPRWGDYDKTYILLEVDFDELDEVYVEFCARSDDIYPWGPELFNRAVAGEFGEVAEREIPEDITGESAISVVRKIRNDLLTTEVDPITKNPLRWDALSAEKQQEWRDYRQALLDLTTSYPNARLAWNVTEREHQWVDLTFPTKPE